MQTKILTEVPADLWLMFHNDPIVAKYRLILGRLVYELFIAPKSDRPAILARKEQVHRQIKGRQIQLFKSGMTGYADGTTTELATKRTMSI